MNNGHEDRLTGLDSLLSAVSHDNPVPTRQPQPVGIPDHCELCKERRRPDFLRQCRQCGRWVCFGQSGDFPSGALCDYCNPLASFLGLFLGRKPGGRKP